MKDAGDRPRERLKIPDSDVATTKQALVHLLEPTIEGMGYELADLEVHMHGRAGSLRIFIDHENGITVDDCEAVSRQVSSVLDVADPIAGNYRLEVSSPGLDRRLVKPSHFDRYAGAEVQVRMTRLVDGRRRIRGVLEKRTEDVIVVREGDRQVHLALSDIESARLVPELSSEDRRRFRVNDGL